MRATLTFLIAASCVACEAEPLDRGADSAAMPAVGGAYAANELASSERLPERFGFGTAATPESVSRLDIDIMPDGRGLPAGRATPTEGAQIYATKCSACHGPEGEGTPIGAALVGSDLEDSFGTRGPGRRGGVKTIGNYWPYATTLFDYIRRAMPFDRPGSLTDQEVYALTAYLLYKNRIIAEGAVMDATTLPRVKMPARDRFVPDDRETTSRVR